MTKRVQSYHRELAVQHFVGLLGKRFQHAVLLAFLWTCVEDPWETEPSIYIAASRLEFLFGDRTTRYRALKKLEEIGALKKGKATRSGCKYTLLRPKVNELSDKLQAEITAMGTLDYRFNREAYKRGEIPKPVNKSITVHPLATKRVARKVVTAHLADMRLTWKHLGLFIEKMCGLSKASVRYARGAKDVESLGAWMVGHMIMYSSKAKLFQALRQDFESKPSGNVLRYVFEGDTEEKQAYLRDVLAYVRPSKNEGK